MKYPDSMTSIFRMSIERQAYKMHGGDIYNVSKELNKDYKEVYDFSANINPLGLSKAIKDSITENVEKLIHYPDRYAHKLKELVAKKYHIAKDNIVVGNGAEELMYRLIHTYRRGLRALIPIPTFMAYEESLSYNKENIIENYNIDLDKGIDKDILDCIHKELDLMYLCLPNNPIGSLIDENVLLEIIKKTSKLKVRLVIDISFMDFVEQNKKINVYSYAKQFENIILINSFTKVYAIPGLRLGILYTEDKELLKELALVAPTWVANTLALLAGEAALEHEKDYESLPDYVSKERAYLSQKLQGLGFRVYKSYANYLLFYCDNIKDLYSKLLTKNIIIRKCETIKGLLENHYRIAVRTHEENEYFIKSLKELVKEIK